MNLKKHREKLGLTIEEMGERLGYGKAFLSRIENGLRPIPLRRIKDFAASYDVPTNKIINLLVADFKNKVIKQAYGRP